MSTEQNKAIVRQLIDEINGQNISAINTMVSTQVAGEVKDSLAWIKSTWQDHHLEITDMIAEGDKVWCRLASRGIHTGQWMGIAATGRHWTNSGIGFIQISDGKIVAIEWFFDVLNHITQLGATIKTQ